MFATISHLRSTGSSGIRFRSPYLVTTLKHEQSSWKMTRSGVHSHRSTECYGFHEDTVCQDHEIGYLGRYERSESMPLLHRENRPTSGRFQRMLQSSILITCQLADKRRCFEILHVDFIVIFSHYDSFIIIVFFR